MAPPTTKRPTIMITDVLEKPAKASLGVRISRIISEERAHNATMSERILPEMKNTIVSNSMMSVGSIPS